MNCFCIFYILNNKYQINSNMGNLLTTQKNNNNNNKYVDNMLKISKNPMCVVQDISYAKYNNNINSNIIDVININIIDVDKNDNLLKIYKRS